MSSHRQLFAFLATLLVAIGASANAFAVAPPYVEDFESEPTCGTTCATVCTLSTTGWLNDTTDNRDWLVDVGGTPSSSTGPSVDHNPGTSAGKYLYLEASSPCDSVANVSNLISPPLDLAGAIAPGARIWYHLYGSNMGTLHIDVLDAAMAVLLTDVVPSVTGNLNQWQQSPLVDLTPFLANGTVHIRVRGVHSGAGFLGDMAVDDFEFKDFGQPDAAVVSLDSPVSGCGMSAAETVTVTIQNLSLIALSGFGVQYVLDGGLPVAEMFNGSVPAAGSASFTFSTLADLSAPGLHTLDVTTLVVGDADPSNDTLASSVNSGATLPAIGYVQDFEGAQSWMSGGTNSSWALGTPAGSVIQGAASGVNAWMTGLSSNYNNSEQSFVEAGVCFDFSAALNPAVSMNVWWSSESGWDGAVLQTSVDGGQSWQTVGAVGDPGWYNDSSVDGAPGGSTDGWSGNGATGSGTWVTVLHNLTGIGGMAGVKMRVAFGSDTSVNTYDGFAFDDVALFDNITNSVIVSNSGNPSSIPGFGVPAGSANAFAQGFALTGLGVGPHAAQSVTVHNLGTIVDANVSAVKLWLDNGDGKFSAVSDTLLDTQALVGGAATFSANGMVSVGSLQSEVLFVSFDLAAGAAAGDTFGSAIVSPSVDVVFAGNVAVSALNPPIEGPALPVAGAFNGLPFYDDFSSVAPNRSAQGAAGGIFPTAPGVGTTINLSAPTTADALIQVLPNVSTLFPQEGTGLGAISFPNGRATGGIDYLFDLSAYTASEPLWLSFSYSDAGEEDDTADQVFVSLDGGASWLASIYDFDWTLTSIAGGWLEKTVDLSAMLTSYGADYTSQVMIRFQASDDSSISADGLLIDRVFLGLPMELEVDRIAGMPLATGATDDLGTLPVIGQSFTYNLSNIGHLPLTVDVASMTITNVMNAANVSVTPPASGQIDPQAMAMAQIDFTPGLGAFSFDLVFDADDPRLMGNSYTLTISGIGGPADCSVPGVQDGTYCDDNDACTQLDFCLAGACLGMNPVVCPSTDQCNFGSCDPATGACSTPNVVDGTACDDGDLCTQTDTCQAGACVGDNPVVCTALDQCHVPGVCDPSTGVCDDPEEVDGTDCDDGDLCTQTDSCQAGLCVGDNPVVCMALDACHVAGVCDPTTGVCDDPNGEDGTACDDGDLCTQVDACEGGICVGGDPVTCDALDSCHDVGTCDPTTGVCDDPELADGTVCEDGTCQGGDCVPDATGSGGAGGTGAGGGGTETSSTSSGAGGNADGGVSPGGDGCSCSLPGETEQDDRRGVLALALVGLVFLRRRRAP